MSILKHYRLIFSYSGTSYQGWQDQSVLAISIQGKIKQSFACFFGHHNFNIFAASRTDKGTHAFNQYCRLDIEEELDCNHFLKKINSKLDDIVLKSIEACSREFNPLNSKSKEYHYYFSFEDKNPLLLKQVYFTKKINLSIAKKKLEQLLGEHDFSQYTSAKYKNSLRTIYDAKIQESIIFGTQVYILKIRGDGFLKYMVRYIVGYLLHSDESKTPYKVPSHGLYLYDIRY
ncbi:MAG: hypothetical protein N4A33_04705 [Bacteriovoracaceae bacterium]|nr:hypothetical protein [Bacteriovoracaceae bacterium]